MGIEEGSINENTQIVIGLIVNNVLYKKGLNILVTKLCVLS